MAESCTDYGRAGCVEGGGGKSSGSFLDAALLGELPASVGVDEKRVHGVELVDGEPDAAFGVGILYFRSCKRSLANSREIPWFLCKFFATSSKSDDR